MTFTVAKFKDVADGTQAGQFTVGAREKVASLSDLAPIYRQLIDEPVTAGDRSAQQDLQEVHRW